MTRCEIPPAGWWCSRERGHEGPCAARPKNPAHVLCAELYARFDDEPDFLGHEAAQLIEIMGEAIQKIHRYALAAEGTGYDLILSVTDPIIQIEDFQR